jgi:hypothetical protein
VPLYVPFRRPKRSSITADARRLSFPTPRVLELTAWARRAFRRRHRTRLQPANDSRPLQLYRVGQRGRNLVAGRGGVNINTANSVTKGTVRPRRLQSSPGVGREPPGPERATPPSAPPAARSKHPFGIRRNAGLRSTRARSGGQRTGRPPTRAYAHRARRACETCVDCSERRVTPWDTPIRGSREDPTRNLPAERPRPTRSACSAGHLAATAATCFQPVSIETQIAIRQTAAVRGSHPRRSPAERQPLPAPRAAGAGRPPWLTMLVETWCEPIPPPLPPQ